MAGNGTDILSRSGIGYRREIDGLRAIAVLPVILFHAGVTTFAGGFLGVDIFFVISGYLITSLIERDLEQGRFSIVDFYLRRFRRILPALLLMMAITLPVAYRLMLPDDLENYGQSLVATTLSANNVLLYLTQDYFAMESEFKPLIHTWSLGVEEQYYLAVPLIMSLAFLVGRKRGAVAAVALVTIASMACCIVMRESDADGNFYLIMSRAWELGIGGLGALCEPRLRALAPSRGGGAAAAAGLSAIVLPIFLFDGGMNLPGPATAVPVLGTVAILCFASPGNLVGKVLSLRPMVGIGLLSYSAYLYHQPVLAFVRIASLTPPDPLSLVAVLPAIFFLAYLSWRFVERPFRDRRRVSTRMLLTVVCLGSAILGTAGLTFHATSGFRAQWLELAGRGQEFGARQNSTYNMEPFRYLDRPFATARPRILVLGNSFARDFINMGLESGMLDGAQISYAEIDECLPLKPLTRRIAATADYIVLGSGVNWQGLPCIARLSKTLGTISDARIVVLGTKGFGWNNNAVMLLDPAERYSYRVRPVPEIIDGDRVGKAAFPASTYLSILDMIGDDRRRVPVFTPDRKFISQDRKHLTRAGAGYVGNILFRHPLLAPMRADGVPPGGIR